MDELNIIYLLRLKPAQKHENKFFGTLNYNINSSFFSIHKFVVLSLIQQHFDVIL